MDTGHVKLFRTSRWLDVLDRCPPATIESLRATAEHLAADTLPRGASRSHAAVHEYVVFSNTAFDWLERNTAKLGRAAVYLRMLQLESYARVQIAPLAG